MGLLDNLKFAYYASSMNEVVSKTKEITLSTGEKIVEKYKEANEKFNEISERCADWPDEKLISKYKLASNEIERLAYYGELKNRGLISNKKEE